MNDQVRFFLTSGGLFLQCSRFHQNDDHPEASQPGAQNITGGIITHIRRSGRVNAGATSRFQVYLWTRFPVSKFGRKNHRLKVFGETGLLQPVRDFSLGDSVGHNPQAVAPPAQFNDYSFGIGPRDSAPVTIAPQPGQLSC